MDLWLSGSSTWGCLCLHTINTYRTFLAILPTRHFCPHKLAAWIPSHTVWFTSWCQLRTWSHWARPCWSKMGEWALPCLALAASQCSLPCIHLPPWLLCPRLQNMSGIERADSVLEGKSVLILEVSGPSFFSCASFLVELGSFINPWGIRNKWLLFLLRPR